MAHELCGEVQPASPNRASLVMRIASRVLDVTAFAGRHPGGMGPLETYAGRDATDAFLAMHGPCSRAWKTMAAMPDADTAAVTAEMGMAGTEAQRGFRDLACSLGKEVIARRAECARHWLSQLSLGCLSFFAAAAFTGPVMGAPLMAAPLLAIALFQVGWFSHDLAHQNALPGEPTRQAALVGVIGSLLGGYSRDWWCTKHNRMHHVHTNVVGGDEDIDTLPLICWSAKVLRGADKARMLKTRLVRYQHILAWAYLAFARLFWRWRSIQWVAEKRRWGEVPLLAGHYAVYIAYVSALKLSYWRAAAFVLAVEMAAGWLTAFVFVQSHNGKDVFRSDEAAAMDFWEHQLRTTSNVTPSGFNDWFTGCLNYQIEHHLFPWLPRMLMPSARTRVMALCQRHGLPYREYGWADSTRIVYEHLSDVASAVEEPCR